MRLHKILQCNNIRAALACYAELTVKPDPGTGIGTRSHLQTNQPLALGTSYGLGLNLNIET
jgi:hypothetical protein